MISLIILAYNDGKSLLEHIPGWVAVLEQTPSYELIISDDGSSDNTEEVSKYFMQQYPNVRYIRSDKNCGVGANFRMGLGMLRSFFRNGLNIRNGCTLQKFHHQHLPKALP